MAKSTFPHEETLRELHGSLDERWQPEDIAQKLLSILDLTKSECRTVGKAANSRRPSYWTSMSKDFHRPVNMKRQLSVAQQLFDKPVSFLPDDTDQIEVWLQEAEESIGKRFGDNDFKYSRLSKSERLEQGIEISRRQYNKRFRLAVRMEKKIHRLKKEQFKRALTLASKSRLVSQISWDDFCADHDSAAFIAYYVSRCNLRSVFTNTSQVRPYDDICDCLMKRCQKKGQQVNWWAIAHVYPHASVIKWLDDEQKGVLLGDYFAVMQNAAKLLEELWESNDLSDDMIVRRGNDSTTWNVTAGAWNKLREGWISFMYELGLVDAVDAMCPGKVLRLMAADVAWWHRRSGGDIHPDTKVWKELPRPWDVVLHEVPCPKDLVDRTCVSHGLDPVKSGWSAPRPGKYVETFTPTPELVHGVVVSSPVLASVFRKAGVFSGKKATGICSAPMVDEIRSRHLNSQEDRRREIENKKSTV